MKSWMRMIWMAGSLWMLMIGIVACGEAVRGGGAAPGADQGAFAGNDIGPAPRSDSWAEFWEEGKGPCGRGSSVHSWRTCSEIEPRYEPSSRPYPLDGNEEKTLAIEDSASWAPICLGGCPGAWLGPLGTFEIEGQRLKIKSGGAKVPEGAVPRFHGAYFKAPVEGHFDAEVEFDPAEPSGLAIVYAKEQQGKLVPDPDSFTAVLFGRDELERPVFEVRDRQLLPQEGGTMRAASDVLDNTDTIVDVPGGTKKRTLRYRHTLTGTYYADGSGRNDYRVPFSETNGKLRIFYDQPAGFFHFYYGVKKQILGDAEPTEGWSELAPSRGWEGRLGKGKRVFFVALLTRGQGDPIFEHLAVRKVPTQDRADARTGFKVTRREYNWSGFSGDAFVVTFGPEFPYGDSRKLVFWSEANYAPVWHLNDQLLVSYEFVELWSRGDNFYNGCAEPMSDRLRYHNYVEVLEDNEVQKILHWRYQLVNPAYQTIWSEHYRHWGNVKPEFLPYADEYWTVYADGTVYRHVRYTPDKNATALADNTFEVAEMMVIAGSLTHPYDHLLSRVAPAELYDPTLQKQGEGVDALLSCDEGSSAASKLVACPQSVSLFNLDGVARSGEKGFNFDYLSFVPARERNDAPHPSFPDTHYNPGWGNLPANNWDEVIATVRLRDRWDLGPVAGPEPYMVFQRFNGPNHTSGDYPLLVDLTWHGYNYLFSHWPVGKEPFEYHDKSFADFRAQVSHSSLVSVMVDGGGQEPEVKEWVFLLGLNEPGQDEVIKDRARGWLRQARVAAVDTGCVFRGTNFYQGTVDLELVQGESCTVALSPGQEGTRLRNPVLQIQGWRSLQAPAHVYVDGKPLDPDQYRISWQKDRKRVLLWLGLTLDAAVLVTISGVPIALDERLCAATSAPQRCLESSVLFAGAEQVSQPLPRRCADYRVTYGKPFLCLGANLCRLLSEDPRHRDDPQFFCVTNPERGIYDAASPVDPAASALLGDLQ